MATTIITPTQPTQDNANAVATLVIGLLMLVVLGLLFFFYALPAIQNMSDTGMDQATLNLTVPTNTSGQESSQSTSPNVPY